MKIIPFLWVLLTIVGQLPSEGTLDGVDKVPTATAKISEELLPEPAAQRGSRYPLRRNTPSYDPIDAYESLSGNRNSIRRFDFQDLIDSNSDIAEELLDPKSDYHLDEPIASASELEATEKTGYGYTCTSGYINASAVALLAFLFLLHIIQDIIIQVIADTAAAGRKKRDADYSTLMFNILLKSGALDTFYQDLPHIVIPLLVKLVDNNGEDCVARPICEANLKLSEKFGPIGRVFGTLMSNVFIYIFTFFDSKAFKVAQEAAAFGRSAVETCSAFHDCSE